MEAIGLENVKAVLVDLGNVIARFSHPKACEQIAALREPRGDAGAIYRWIFGQTGWEGINRLLETGELAPEDFWIRCREAWALRCGREEFFEAWSDIFEIDRVMVEEVIRLRDTCPVYLCSNTNPLHWSQVMRLEPRLGSLFDGLFLSYHVGARKPSETYFRHVTAKIGLAAGECLLIDDLEVNTEAARKLGIRAVRFEAVDKLRRDLGLEF
jgi:FMN phosphatase YigB (HAD superfamily)